MGDPESDFNLKVVLVSFKQCLTEDGQVLLDHYITSWKGLVRCVSTWDPCIPQGTGTWAQLADSFHSLPAPASRHIQGEVSCTTGWLAL